MNMKKSSYFCLTIKFRCAIMLVKYEETFIFVSAPE